MGSTATGTLRKKGVSRGGEGGERRGLRNFQGYKFMILQWGERKRSYTQNEGSHRHMRRWRAEAQGVLIKKKLGGGGGNRGKKG